MRIFILTALLLAGCGSVSERLADRARSICATNGHPVGAAGFDRCFETTFAAIMYDGDAPRR